MLPRMLTNCVALFLHLLFLCALPPNLYGRKRGKCVTINVKSQLFQLDFEIV